MKVESGFQPEGTTIVCTSIMDVTWWIWPVLSFSSRMSSSLSTHSLPTCQWGTCVVTQRVLDWRRWHRSGQQLTCTWRVAHILWHVTDIIFQNDSIYPAFNIYFNVYNLFSCFVLISGCFITLADIINEWHHTTSSTWKFCVVVRTRTGDLWKITTNLSSFETQNLKFMLKIISTKNYRILRNNSHENSSSDSDLEITEIQEMWKKFRMMTT